MGFWSSGAIPKVPGCIFFQIWGAAPCQSRWSRCWLLLCGIQQSLWCRWWSTRCRPDRFCRIHCRALRGMTGIFSLCLCGSNRCASCGRDPFSDISHTLLRLRPQCLEYWRTHVDFFLGLHGLSISLLLPGILAWTRMRLIPQPRYLLPPGLWFFSGWQARGIAQPRESKYFPFSPEIHRHCPNRHHAVLWAQRFGVWENFCGWL